MLKISNEYDIHRRSMMETDFHIIYYGVIPPLAEPNAGPYVGKRRHKRCGVIPPIGTRGKIIRQRFISNKSERMEESNNNYWQHDLQT